MTETRNHWPNGLVRHLRLDENCPPDSMYAIRAEHNGGLSTPGGSTDITYTLVIHPKHADRVEEHRRNLEQSPTLGGLFSPTRAP